MIILTEEQLQREAFKQELKHFFPSIWNDLLGGFQMLLPVATGRVREEEEMFKRNIKNLNLNIRLNRTTSRNAYTYPLLDVDTAQFATLLPGFASIIMLIAAMDNMEKTRMLENAQRSKNQIIFPKTDINFLFFETKGLFTSLDEEQRIAIGLHELGHWVRFENIFNIHVFKIVSSFVPILVPACAILTIFWQRAAEKDADMFVKRLGYGPALISAFKEFSNIRPDVSWYNKSGDLFQKIFIAIHNVIDIILPLSSHPSMRKRINYLSQEGRSIALESNVLLLNEDLKIKQALLKPIELICHKIDSTLSGHVDKILPI